MTCEMWKYRDKCEKWTRRRRCSIICKSRFRWSNCNNPIKDMAREIASNQNNINFPSKPGHRSGRAVNIDDECNDDKTNPFNFLIRFILQSDNELWFHVSNELKKSFYFPLPKKSIKKTFFPFVFLGNFTPDRKPIRRSYKALKYLNFSNHLKIDKFSGFWWRKHATGELRGVNTRLAPQRNNKEF